MSKVDHYYAVIMAGGGGTRLWPLSRQGRPKQMLSLLEDRSLFQISVERIKELFPLNRIYVITVKEQAAALQEQCPELPPENYLLEPLPRGTASVVGLGAVALQRQDPQAVMAVLASDHFIENEPAYRQALAAAYDLAQEGYLVTLGITPTFPATGYGYIQRGERLGRYRELDAYHALRFREKPDEQTAQQLIQDGQHSWNSGMFIWRVDRILEEFKVHMPGLYGHLETISEAWDSPRRAETLERIWPEIRPETIDYGVMERAERVAVIPASNLGWNDVGSWDSLFEMLPADEDGNIILGRQHIGLDTRRSLIYGDGSDRLVVTIGIDDLVVVDTGDVLLVCRKDQAQRVRQVVELLKKTSQDHV